MDFSGDRYVLDNGTAHAEIGAVAAVLRTLSVDGVRITETVPADTLPPHGCGIVLAPWPNRVRDGKWTLDDKALQLDISEPATGNASHGLLRNTAYQVAEQTPDALTLTGFVAPQHGWPFALETRVRYALEPDGLTVTHGVRNRAERPAPWAVGAHPYFRIGDVPHEQLRLEISGTHRNVLDERLIPIDTVPVEGTEFDLRAGRMLADVDLNVAFTGLGIGAGDHTGERGDVASLTAPDGSSVTVWHDAAFGWCQAYTPRDFPRPDAESGVGLAVALEPMTAAPDALNSGDGLIWLDPDAEWQGSWGVRYEAAQS